MTCEEKTGGRVGLKETLIVNPYFSREGWKTSKLQSGGLRPPPASEVHPKLQVSSFMPHNPLLKVLGHVLNKFPFPVFANSPF